MPELPQEPFAVGRTAKLYAWKPGWALKLYEEFPWMSEHYPTQEGNITRAVHQAGIPSPDVGAVLQVNGRWALELQRLDGPTLGDVFAKKPWTMRHAALQLSRLHRHLHSVDFGIELPSQIDRLRHKINAGDYLSSGQKARVLAILDALPRGDRLCHGDFHPWNIIVTADGPAIIDWVDTTRGHVLGDVARTVLLLRGIAHMDGVKINPLQRLALDSMARTYLHDYLKHRPDTGNTFSGWMAVIAAGRIDEGIAGQQDWLLELVDRNLVAWDKH